MPQHNITELETQKKKMVVMSDGGKVEELTEML